MNTSSPGSSSPTGCLDRLDALLRRRPGLRLRVVCPSQEFGPHEMAHGVARWWSGIRGLWEVLAVPARPDLVLVMMQAPLVPAGVVDYLLRLSGPSPRRFAGSQARFGMVELDDGGPRHLSEKFLTSPGVLARLRDTIRLARAYGHAIDGLACFASSQRMADLADALELDLLETPPSTLCWGTKSASRELFRQTGVPHQPGTYRPVYRSSDLAGQLCTLALHHGPGQWLVKINSGFGSGHGNALVTVDHVNPAAVDRAVHERLTPASSGVRRSDFFQYMLAEGAVVEQYAVAPAGLRLCFPSATLMLDSQPDGSRQFQVVGTHDQMIGTDQSFIGASSPADAAYRAAVLKHASLIAEQLALAGARGHAGIDFLALGSGRNPNDWAVRALEVNLRQTGTTHADRTVALLTGARLVDGRPLSPDGCEIYYLTTDGLMADRYKGIKPSQLVAALRTTSSIGFNASSRRGVVPHLWTTLQPFGKIGATVIGGSPTECSELLERFDAKLTELGDGGLHTER